MPKNFIHFLGLKNQPQNEANSYSLDNGHLDTSISHKRKVSNTTEDDPMSKKHRGEDFPTPTKGHVDSSSSVGVNQNSPPKLSLKECTSRLLKDFSNIDNQHPIHFQKNSFENEPSMLTGPPNILTCLKLLSAVEKELDSIGPSITQLLLEAINLEKKSFGLSKNLLKSSENINLLELAEAKLKTKFQLKMLCDSHYKVVPEILHNINKILKFVSSQNDLEYSTLETLGLAHLHKT